eukprot:Gb_05738 [translate_table: standard]
MALLPQNKKPPVSPPNEAARELRSTHQWLPNTHELSLLSTSSSLTKLKNLQVLYLVGFHSLKSMVLGFSGLSNLKCLLLHDCKEIVQLPGLGFLAHMEKLYINHSPKLHSLDGLNELKHLKHLHVFLSEDVLQQNSMVLQQDKTGMDAIDT